jgi:hypothetical protein
METIRTKEKIQALLGYVELCRIGKRKVVFWSYAVTAIAVSATVALAFFGVAMVEVFVGALAVALLAGLLGYTVSRDHRRWRYVSGELRGWLAETELELQAEKPALRDRSGGSR